MITSTPVDTISVGALPEAVSMPLPSMGLYGEEDGQSLQVDELDDGLAAMSVPPSTTCKIFIYI